MDNDMHNNKSKSNSAKKCVKSKVDPDENEVVESTTDAGNGEAQLDQSVIVVCKDISTIDLSETNGWETGAVDDGSVGNPTRSDKLKTCEVDIMDPDKKESMVSLATSELKTTSSDVLILETSYNLDRYLEKRKSVCAKVCEATIESNVISEVNDVENLIETVDADKAKTVAIDENNDVEKKKVKKEKSKLNKAKPAKIDPDDTKPSLKRSCDEDEVAKKKIKTETDDDDDATAHDENLTSQVGEDVDAKPTKKYAKGDEKKAESRCVWIYDLPQSTKASNMRVHLSQHGKVAMAKIVTDGKQFYGYALMEKREDVGNCIKHLNDTLFEGRKIRVSDKGPNSGRDVDKVKNGEENRKDVELKPRRVIHKISDPLTLKIDSDRCDRYSAERKRRRRDDEIQLREKTLHEKREMIRRDRQQRELEAREERRRQRIRDEEKREFVMKIERERRRLDQERHLIEKERYELLRLQKKLADTERSMLNRQKLEVERNLRNITQEFKKSRSPNGGFDRKNEAPASKGYWKNDKISSPLKAKNVGFNVEGFSKKVARDEGLCAPPAPILTDTFDLSSRVRKVEKERSWECRKDYSARPAFKDGGKGFEKKGEDNRNYVYDRRDCPEKTYVRERYKPKESTKFDKSHSSNSWDKVSQMQYKNSATSWSNRTAPRYQPQSFIAPHFVQNPVVPHCYPGPAYARSADVYGRSPERKY